MRYVRYRDTKKLADPEIRKFTFILEVDQILERVNCRGTEHAQVKAVFRSKSRAC